MKLDNRLALALLALATAAPAHAVKFELGNFEGSFVSNLSLGASWRTQDPDFGVLTPGNTDGKGRASSSTADDGNLNYDKGDLYSLLIKGVHDLQLSNDRIGVFTRFKYWYDYALDERDVAHGHAANDYAADEPLNTSDFEDLAQESGFEFLDYYVFGNLDLGEMPLELRAGNMVLSWGESTFIQNGVNVISPFDVTALRRPGTEIKEALLPVGLVYGNLGVTADLSMELFYQYDWQRTILDECGTYWSAADPYGGGCDYLTATTSVPDAAQVDSIFRIDRADDREAGDSGQWGVAFRYFVESLNATEFGLYYMNLHSRTPIFSAYNTEEALGAPILNPAVQPRFFFEFPEDIDLYGLTFATYVADWAWSGELSYRPDYPLQINTVDLLQSLALGTLAEWSPMLGRSLAAGPGGYVSGFDEVEYLQAQTTLIRFFDQVLGSERLSLAAEFGGVWISGMEKGINYGRSSAYGINGFQPFASAAFPGATISCTEHPLAPTIVPNSNGDYCEDEGFTDDFSWGYRVRASLDYSNVFAGINLTPNVAWSHDVHGTSPAPNFIEDRMALSVGLRADYLNTYQADISYTSFFGADYNELQDRDCVSLSFSVAF
jgi:hypothetical protein